MYVFDPESVRIPAPFFVNPPVPESTPLNAELPEPRTVSRLPPFAIPFTTVNALPLSFRHVCAAPSVTATCCPAVADPIVTAPLPLAILTPPVPNVSPKFVPPACSRVVPAFVPRNSIPITDRAAPRLTVRFVFVIELNPNTTESVFVGTAPGA